MISRSYQQFAIVCADSAQSLTEQLNAKLYDLRDKNPTVTFEGLIARIQYVESEMKPETLAEEYESQGVNLTCYDCPFFVPQFKADGTEDQRAKWGGCPWKETKRAMKTSKACDKLYQMLNNGEVKLCASTK
jgi:hypothetical protein